MTDEKKKNIQKMSDEEKPTKETAPKINSKEKDLKEKKGSLLFVDDEKSILKALKRMFVPLGYTVFIAESGKAGLAMLEENEIDLIISDMRMPEMDGAAFLKAAAEQWPEIKRILLTGYADMESAISAVNEGKIKLLLREALER